MRSFISRESHDFQSKPDLMPLGAVLLALMMVFVFQLPRPSLHIDQDLWGGCGHNEKIPLEVVMYLDENGEVLLDDRSLSHNAIPQMLAAMRQSPNEYLTVYLHVAPEAAYEDMVATAAAIKNAGVDRLGIWER